PRGPGQSAAGQVPRMEEQPHHGAGPPDAPPARPTLLPQGPLPLPFLHPPGRRRGIPRQLVRTGVRDRLAPARPPPVGLARLAGKRPRSAPVFLRDPRRGRQGPALVLAPVPGRRAEDPDGGLAAALRAPQVAALPAAQRQASAAKAPG